METAGHMSIRKRLDELGVAIDGHQRFTMDAAGSLRADAYALQAMQNYQRGKLILHPWIARGFTTFQKVAEWFHNGDVDAAKEAMKQTPGHMKNLLQLEDLPHLNLEKENATVVAAESPLSDERHIVWAITQGERHILLPDWFKSPIDTTILVWRREWLTWKDRKDKRAAEGKELAPVSKAKYDAWLKQGDRTIILNKSKGSQLLSIKDKTQDWLKKTCLHLTIRMSGLADELKIRAGAGPWYKLVLLESQSATPVRDVPEVMQAFPDKAAAIRSMQDERKQELEDEEQCLDERAQLDLSLIHI